MAPLTLTTEHRVSSNKFTEYTTENSQARMHFSEKQVYFETKNGFCDVIQTPSFFFFFSDSLILKIPFPYFPS